MLKAQHVRHCTRISLDSVLPDGLNELSLAFPVAVTRMSCIVNVLSYDDNCKSERHLKKMSSTVNIFI